MAQAPDRISTGSGIPRPTNTKGLQLNVDKNPFDVGGHYGSYMRIGQNSEEITLATGGTTTDTSATFLPANSEILAVAWRVTTAITTAVNFTLGDSATAARFQATNTNVDAGDTGIGWEHRDGGVSSDAAGPVQRAAAALRITTNANPGAGAVRVQVWYRQFVAPTA